MFTATLFLGLEVTPPVAALLDDADPELVKAFVKDDDAYLQDVTYEGGRYLGKSAGGQTDVAALELLEANIRTLLAKVVPGEDWSETPLQLFPMIEAQRHAGK